MALSGKLIGYVEISKKGDVFHDLLRHKPDDMAVMSPYRIIGCDLVTGDRGVVGSLVHWHYIHEGKRKIAKDIIESVNEENHTIVFKVIGGELVDELYTSFKIIFHVEQKGDGELATWTLEFERPDTSVPYPTSLMDWLCDVIKDMDIPMTALSRSASPNKLNKEENEGKLCVSLIVCFVSK